MAREMKDSGVPWIGAIPVDWFVEKLKFTASFCQEKYREDLGALVYVGLENIASWNGKFIETESEYDRGQSILFSQNDILWGKLRPYLAKVFHCQENGCCSGEFCVIRPRLSIDVRFLWNTLISVGFVSAVDQSTYGTKMPRANADFIKNMIIPIPPSPEQKGIGVFLDKKCAEIDTVLEKTRASIEEYKKLKQAIITQAVTKGVRGDRPMKESGVEWASFIPSKWENVSPKALFSQRKEKAAPGERQLTSSQKYGIVYQDDYMELTGSRVVVVQKDFDILKHVEAGDFVISMRSFQGGLEYSTRTGSISSAYVMLVPNLNYVYPCFYRWLLKSEVYIRALQRTSNMVRDGQAMRYSNFAQVRLYTVPLQEQMEIADYLDEKCAMLDALIEKKEKFVSEMDSYKKSLIYEYVTGKKEVPPAQFQATIAFIDTRALLLCRIIELLKPKGRIHLMKAVFTVDCLLDLNSVTQYQRQKHGPYDVQIEEYEQIMEQNGWVRVQKGSPVNYVLSREFEMYRKSYQIYFGKVDEQIQRICAFLRPMKTSKAERVATLLAAWNDFILDGIAPTDQQIVQEVRSNWTPNKAHSSEATWLGTLSEMKEHQIIPFGHGKHTIHTQDNEV